MSQKVALLAIISASRSLAAEVLEPRFVTPFTLVYRCSKYTRKLPLLTTFGSLRRGVRTDQFARQGVAGSSDRTEPVLGRAIPEPTA
jgi:hypothetical protein